MSHTIAINKSHANSDYSEYTYQLPNVMQLNDIDHSIAFVGANVNYSWFNISESNNNNYLYYWWFDNTGNGSLIQYSLKITDGYYTIGSLNEYLITNLRDRGHCLKYTSNGVVSYKMYLEILTNASYYNIQIKCHAMPLWESNGATPPVYNVMPTGYAIVSSNNPETYPAWKIPNNTAGNRVPKLDFSITEKFKDFIGFEGGRYPYSNRYNDYSFYGQNAPMVETVSEICLYCNLINNPYSQADNFFYSFSPAGYSIGETIQVKPNFLRYDHVNNGQYQYIKISVRDQDGNKIMMKEPFTSIQLSILNRKY